MPLARGEGPQGPPLSAEDRHRQKHLCCAVVREREDVWSGSSRVNCRVPQSVAAVAFYRKLHYIRGVLQLTHIGLLGPF